MGTIPGDGSSRTGIAAIPGREESLRETFVGGAFSPLFLILLRMAGGWLSDLRRRFREGPSIDSYVLLRFPFPYTDSDCSGLRDRALVETTRPQSPSMVREDRARVLSLRTPAVPPNDV